MDVVTNVMVMVMERGHNENCPNNCYSAVSYRIIIIYHQRGRSKEQMKLRLRTRDKRVSSFTLSTVGGGSGGKPSASPSHKYINTSNNIMIRRVSKDGPQRTRSRLVPKNCTVGSVGRRVVTRKTRAARNRSFGDKRDLGRRKGAGGKCFTLSSLGIVRLLNKAKCEVGRREGK